MNNSAARRLCACAIAVACFGMASTPHAQQTTTRGPQWNGGAISIVTQEGTNIAVTASPNRDRIVIDLQAVLWSLPFDGGAATRITDDFFEAVRPDWSPDGSRIVVSTFYGGMSHLWSLAPDGSRREQLTSGPFDDVDPRWSPDGSSIAFISDRSGGREVWIYDVASHALTQVTDTQRAEPWPNFSPGAPISGTKSEPTWSGDGASIGYVTEGVRIDVTDLKTKAVRTVVPAGPGLIFAPSWSPDGRRLTFVQNGRLMLADLAGGSPRLVAGFDDAFPFPAKWLSNDELLYTANGRIHRTRIDGGTREVPFSAKLELQRSTYRRKGYDFDSVAPQPVKGIAGPAISPDGRTIVFKALNDLWLLPIDGTAKKLTNDSFYEIDPVWSRDGKRIAYASDKGGTPDLYVRDAKTGTEQRVTTANGAEVAPAWASDGKRLAFLDEKPDLSTGDLFLRDLCVLDLASGRVERILANLDGPGRPSWSADGQSIAFTGRSRSRNRIGIVNVASKRVQYHDAAPDRSISTRGDDGPMWSPDGKLLAFSMGSTLWVLPVAADGSPSGPARQITTEASDAPSWSGDSRRLLYLHNGELRLVDIRSNSTKNITTGLTFKQDVPRGRTVIHAGRVWDGINAQPHENVDITVVDNRIESIAPHDPARGRAAGVRFVDAATLTVTPGLFDMHYHQHLAMKSYGDRAGRLALAYGVTSTRSTGDPVYRALEDRESLAAGARVGARFFMTGEMLEGPRFEWEFTRPVESAAQLPLELSRIKALDYDLIKTYVRFGFDSQAQVIKWAQDEIGITTTSHYLYPAVAHGGNAQEHMGGPTRWGFWFSHMGNGRRTYQDVFDLVTKARMQETTTIFSSAALLAEDPAVVADVRLKTLLTGADRATLEGKVACVNGTGPCGFLPPSRAYSQAAANGLARLSEGGVMILVGTDSPFDTPAISVHGNLRALALAMTPFQALQAATINPARAQGVEKDLGSIEPGKLADLVFVSGNPARDIDDLINVRQVMKGGRLYSIAELLAPFTPHARQ